MTSLFANLPFNGPFRGLAALRVQQAEFRRKWQRARAQRQEFARITQELESYTDRELADLRLSRADIPSVASGAFGRT